jgi:prepilin-type N-terminal cleavage/methylation domain-containing protein
MHLPKTSEHGFSLIELLVVVSIMVTLLGIGVASYTSFNQTTIIEGAIKELRANLRLAQAFAINGERIPQADTTACAVSLDTFNGYYVTFNTSTVPHSYTMGQYCSDGNTVRNPPGAKSLPTNFTFSALTASPLTILFKSVKGVEFYNSTTCCNSANLISNSSAFVTICSQSGGCSGSNTRSVTITAEGKIE